MDIITGLEKKDEIKCREKKKRYEYGKKGKSAKHTGSL